MCITNTTYPQTHPYICACVRERQIYFKAHGKSAGQTNRPQSQGGTDVIISRSKTPWRRNSFFFREPFFFSLQAFNSFA